MFQSHSHPASARCETPMSLGTASAVFTRSLHRENLDSKPVAFSMLALCKKMLEQQIIGKLNANFYLTDCRIN